MYRLLEIFLPVAAGPGRSGHRRSVPARSPSSATRSTRLTRTTAARTACLWFHAELRDSGIWCWRKRVARLMRAAHLESVHRRRFVHTTVQTEDAAPTSDLVERLSAESRLDALWVAHITYVWTWAGFLCVTVMLDVYSRRIVGPLMAGH